MAERLFLPRQSRIRKQAEYSACYERGRRYHTEHFLVFVRPRENGACTRMGMAVSRKVGKAVTRNRVKRLAGWEFLSPAPGTFGRTSGYRRCGPKAHRRGGTWSQDRVNAQLLPLLQRLPGLHPARNNGGLEQGLAMLRRLFVLPIRFDQLFISPGPVPARPFLPHMFRLRPGKPS